jgi:hypothetical protein
MAEGGITFGLNRALSWRKKSKIHGKDGCTFPHLALNPEFREGSNRPIKRFKR